MGQKNTPPRGKQFYYFNCLPRGSISELGGYVKFSSKSITACYSKTEIQKCIIHQIRNSTRYVSYKDLKKVTADLKPIY